jgi:hypothetical protein
MCEEIILSYFDTEKPEENVQILNSGKLAYISCPEEEAPSPGFHSQWGEMGANCRAAYMESPKGCLLRQ